jgi:threonine-phosphate decarboxylase
MDPETVTTAERVPHGGVDDADVLDFSANTNPETPPGVASVAETALSEATRYPNDSYPEYRAAAAEYVGCDPEQVVATPGGLAGLRLAVETRVEPGDKVLVPAPSFGEYAREVSLQGATPEFVRYDRITAVDPSDYATVIVCHPNNPTGDGYDENTLRAFAERCRETGTELLADEAFLGFTDRPSLAGTPGVVVARSLTKLFGLPGVRAGFLVATGERRDALATARRAWNLGTVAARVGAHAMRRDEFVRVTRDRVAAERDRLHDGLDCFCDGLDCPRDDLDDCHDDLGRLGEQFTVHQAGSSVVGPVEADRVVATDAADSAVENTTAPFLLVDVGDRSVASIRSALLDRGIAVRDATTFRGLDNHVRVAVRTPEENDRLLEALADV